MPKRASLGHGQKWLRLRLHSFEFTCCTCRYLCRDTTLYRVQRGRAAIDMGDRPGMSSFGIFYVGHSCDATIEYLSPQWMVTDTPPSSLEEMTDKRLQT